MVMFINVWYIRQYLHAINSSSVFWYNEPIHISERAYNYRIFEKLKDELLDCLEVFMETLAQYTYKKCIHCNDDLGTYFRRNIESKSHRTNTLQELFDSRIEFESRLHSDWIHHYCDYCNVQNIDEIYKKFWQECIPEHLRTFHCCYTLRCRKNDYPRRAAW